MDIKYRRLGQFSLRAVGIASLVCLMSYAAYAMMEKKAPLANGSGDQSYRVNTDASSDAREEKPIERLREGEELDGVLGRFVVRGERLFFHPADSKRHFIGLENLILERISRELDNQFEDLDWSVSGQVTEYRGANYLLVTRATLRIRNPDHTK